MGNSDNPHINDTSVNNNHRGPADPADPTGPAEPAHIKKIPVVERFGPTIQGEGVLCGVATMFIRLGGCDFKCERCDSLHAVIPELIKQNSEYMTQQELAQWVISNWSDQHTSLITLSGGNPAIHDLSEFVYWVSHAPAGAQKMIAVETQGSIWADWLRDCTFVTVSPKGPGMGEEFNPDHFDTFVNNLIDHTGFSIKIVVFDQRDIEFAVGVMQRWPQIQGRLSLSIGNDLPPAPAKRNIESIVSRDEFVNRVLDHTRMLTEDILQDSRLVGIRILPQIHTLLWGNEQGR